MFNRSTIRAKTQNLLFKRRGSGKMTVQFIRFISTNRKASERVSDQKVYNQKVPKVKRSKRHKVPKPKGLSQKVPSQNIYKNLSYLFIHIHTLHNNHKLYQLDKQHLLTVYLVDISLSEDLSQSLKNLPENSLYLVLWCFFSSLYTHQRVSYIVRL